MTGSYFNLCEPITFKGDQGDGILSFRHYDPNEMVMGKRLADHLRFAVCYWHNFVWPGTDPFGGQTFERPWFGDDMDAARHKADVAFEMFSALGVPYFCFHDFDVRPEGAASPKVGAISRRLPTIFRRRWRKLASGCCGGRPTLQSSPLHGRGGHQPRPGCRRLCRGHGEKLHRRDASLGGENYVLWGGREGYETLLNTRIGQELDQLGRFLTMVVEYKHKIGFTGTILIEPKPQEPTKHQYDFDVATVYGFLKRYGLENEVRVNIEQGHAILAGHSFEHELALANDLGIFGSIDMNRNDYQSGWDTDQFPNNVAEVALAYYQILKGGGFTTGGTNFDAKLRRQSIDPQDLLAAHVGGMDVCARGLKAAAAMLEDGSLETALDERYGGWKAGHGAGILDGSHSLDSLAAHVEDSGLDPQPVSGRQEILEAIVNRYV